MNCGYTVRLKGSTVVPFDHEFSLAVNINYVFICNGLAAALNAKLVLSAITHVRRIFVAYPRSNCSFRYSSVTATYMGLYSLWKITLFPRSEVGRCFSDIEVTVGPT